MAPTSPRNRYLNHDYVCVPGSRDCHFPHFWQWARNRNELTTTKRSQQDYHTCHTLRRPRKRKYLGNILEISWKYRVPPKEAPQTKRRHVRVRTHEFCTAILMTRWRLYADLAIFGTTNSILGTSSSALGVVRSRTSLRRY